MAYLTQYVHTNKLVASKLFKKKDGLRLLDILEEVSFQMMIDEESKSSFTPKY